MSQVLEGLWLGGEISREAAFAVSELIDECLQEGRFPTKVRHELQNLSNAINAQIQALPPPPKPMSDLV